MKNAATGEWLYDPALDDDGGGFGLGHRSTHVMGKGGTPRSFILSELVESRDSNRHQIPSELIPVSHITLPTHPVPVSFSSSPFPSDLSVSPISSNDSSTYDSAFPYLYPASTNFAFQNMNNNMDFFSPCHSSEPFSYIRQPGNFPLARPNFQPNFYPDFQYVHQPISSPCGYWGTSPSLPACTTIDIDLPSSELRTPYLPRRDLQIPHSAPQRYTSMLQPSNTTNFPYMNAHSTSIGRDVIESEFPGSSSVRDDYLVRSRLPETRVSSNYHQVDDIIQANQASRMLLGYNLQSCGSSEDATFSPSSVWSIMDTSTNKNLNRRRGRHLSLKEIPVCAIPWHVDDPRKALKQKVVRDTSGTIPHDVYDSFYEVVSNKKRCKFCAWMHPIERRNRIEEHVRVHLGYKPLICSICHKAYNRKEDHNNRYHDFTPEA